MILPPNDPVLGNVDEVYTSPFPSEWSVQDPRFEAMLSLGAGTPDEAYAQMQSQAWDKAQRVLMRAAFVSRYAGGIRSDWLPQVAWLPDPGAAPMGLFSQPLYPRSDNAEDLASAAVNAGLVLAQNTLTSVPIVGVVLRAAVGVGRFLAKLLRQPRDKRELQVPWRKFSKSVDEDWVNGPMHALMQGVDWTAIYLPSFSYRSTNGRFRMEKTDKGPGTRAFGFFDNAGEPLYANAVGFMAGTEQATEVVQVANLWTGTGGKRVDATTDVASFLPSVNQFSTGAWAMVGKRGNPDMYKVQAGVIADEWTKYFDTLFAQAFEQYHSFGDDFIQKLYLSKILARFVVMSRPKYDRLGLSVDDFGTPFVTPEIFDDGFVGFAGATYHRPDAYFIRPAADRIKRRQKAMLAKTVVSALVRPVDVGDLPRFAAFTDPSPPLSPGYDTFGEELTAYCLEMRERLVSHPARYELAQPDPKSVSFERIATDVRDVDPPFAERLEKTFGAGLSLVWKPQPKDEMGLLDASVVDVEPDRYPGGGPPFPPDSRTSSGAWPYIVVGGATLAATGLAAYYWDEIAAFADSVRRRLRP